MGSGAGRLLRAWRVMPHERRLAAYAAAGLFVAMFLPWYQRQFFVLVGGRLQPGSDSQSAWAQFSFVEAAVLLVAFGVLTLLFQRAEGKAFHLPGGDGWVITIAGFWTCALIVWRIFDKQGGSAHGQNATTYGIEWGIFVALAVAAALAYAGSRIRAAHRPEPPLPGDPPGPGDSPGPGDPPGRGDSPGPGELPGRREPPVPGESRPLSEGDREEPRPPDLGDADSTAPTLPRAKPDLGDTDSTAPTLPRAKPDLGNADSTPDRATPPRDPDPPRERGWLTAPRRDPSSEHRPPPMRWSGERPPEWSGEAPPEWPSRRRPPKR